MEIEFLDKKFGFCHSVLGDAGLHLVVALFHDLPREKTRLSSHFISHDFGKLTLVENETFWGGFQP